MEEEVWAVEMAEPCGSRANADILALAQGDSAVVKGRAVTFCLIAFTTASHSGDVASKKDDVIEEHSAQGCPGCCISKGVPAAALPAGQTRHVMVKVKPRLALNWGAKKDDGLLSVAAHVRASRFYIQAKKNTVNAVRKLSLSMPGGCTVVGVCGGKRIAKFTAPTVDLYDSGGTPVARVGGSDHWDRCASESSFGTGDGDTSYSVPVSCHVSEAGSPQMTQQHTPFHPSVPASGQAALGGSGSLEGSVPLQRTPTAPSVMGAPGSLPAYSPNMIHGPDSATSSSIQFPLQRMQSCSPGGTPSTLETSGELGHEQYSGQFVLQRPDAIGCHSGPTIEFYASAMPRCQTGSPGSSSQAPASGRSGNEGSQHARNKMQGLASRVLPELGSLKERVMTRHGSEKERSLSKAGSEGERGSGQGTR